MCIKEELNIPNKDKINWHEHKNVFNDEQGILRKKATNNNKNNLFPKKAYLFAYKRNHFSVCDPRSTDFRSVNRTVTHLLEDTC